MFPEVRMRRLRRNAAIRDLFSETRLDGNKLIMPVFVEESLEGKSEITSMPGIFRHSVDSTVDYLGEMSDLGLKSAILFGIPSSKDPTGTAAYKPDGVVQETIAKIKDTLNLNVVADLCMCEYTDHGHCGIIRNESVDNDATLDAYRKIARSYAESGVDIIAPSGMMDGQVAAIRETLDTSGYSHIPIMAYSAKYHTSLYGPFRDAAGSKPGFGDRKGYQMDYRNSLEALREIEEDIKEGADVIMVKPALFYLDILARARERFDLPLAAYNVSGEYSAILNAIRSGILGYEAINETLTSIFRAGADIIITYFTEYVLKNSD